jgi:hypothetical protein
MPLLDHGVARAAHADATTEDDSAMAFSLNYLVSIPELQLNF